MNKRSVKLGFKTSIAYGIGGLGEGIGYNFFYGFFLFFLTSVAGIPAALAGTISMVAVICDAVSSPLIGYMSDHSKNPNGRRRPFIVKGALLIGVCLILLYTNLNISLAMKVTYYIAVNMLYWFALTCAIIPHTSLGAELTDDYNERTTLRSYQTFFMNIGAGVALSGTLMIVSFFSEFFPSEAAAWMCAGVFFGIVAFTSYLISYLFTKGKEPTGEALVNKQLGQKTNFFKEYFSIMSNKPLRFVLVVDFCVNFVLGISVSVRVFLYTYTFGFSNAVSSGILLIYSVIIVLGVFVANFATRKIGKKYTMVLGLVLYAMGFFIVFFLPSSQYVAALGLFFEAMGNCTFWMLLYSFAYDSAIVEQFKHGKGNEGIMVSMIGLFMKIGNAIGMQLTGLALSYIGFQEGMAVQTPDTQFGLKVLYCLCSGILMLISAIVFTRYPLTEDKYDRIKDMVEGLGESKDTTGLERIL